MSTSTSEYYYYISADKIGLVVVTSDGAVNPVDVAGTLRYHYYKRDSDLSDDSDSPSWNSAYHYALVHKVLSYIFAQEGDTTKSLYHNSRYEDFVKRARRSKIGGPKRIVQWDY